MNRARRNGQPVPAPELPWSWHKSPGWQGQFARVRRWYNRIHDARHPADIEDHLYAFFQNCCHLREWLQEARVVPQASIEQLFRDSEELRLCQDIANATKHHSLIDPKQSREFSLRGSTSVKTAGGLSQTRHWLSCPKGISTMHSNWPGDAWSYGRTSFARMVCGRASSVSFRQACNFFVDWRPGSLGRLRAGRTTRQPARRVWPCNSTASTRPEQRPLRRRVGAAR